MKIGTLRSGFSQKTFKRRSLGVRKTHIHRLSACRSRPARFADWQSTFEYFVRENPNRGVNAAELEPNNPVLHFELAKTYEDLRNWQKHSSEQC